MPTTFASYDLNQDGMISPAEWDSFYRGAPKNTQDGSYPGGPRPPGQVGLPGYEPPAIESSAGGPAPDGSDPVAAAMAFFQQLTSAFGEGGFEFTPEMLEVFGVALPALGMYGEWQKALYQQDALAFMREELGLKGEELALAREQLAFESGPAWEWYKNVFFPESQRHKELEWETQRYLMDGQRAMSDQELLQGRERTKQAQLATRQAETGAQVARYQALAQMGPGRTSMTSDGRRVRGSGYTYGYV